MSGHVKGWCPSAYRPMMSGDGLLVRLRPRLGRLARADVHVLADVATRFGNGVIGLTARANLQLRGIETSDHKTVLNTLIGAGLVHGDPVLEGRRSVLATPFWSAGDLTDRLGRALDVCLPGLPDLPDKMGFALDTGDAPVLRDASADVRFERGASGKVLIAADGAKGGVLVDEGAAMDVMAELLAWFVGTGGRENGRMARHLGCVDLPDAYCSDARLPDGTGVEPGVFSGGLVAGVPFGSMMADDLRGLVESAEPEHVQLTPWRSLILSGASDVRHPAFVFTADDPILRTSACPGKPGCAEASVTTYDVARRLAGRVGGTLHVSGCAKGCARPKVSDVTLVGRGGRFDLVQNGRASDTAKRTGLSEADILELFS